MKRRRLLLLSLLVAALMVGCCGLWVWRAKRQYALNRELIDALMNHDNTQALALVHAGADPNTRENMIPVPSFQLLLDQLLHRSRPAANTSPSAFLIACGGVTDSKAMSWVSAFPPPEDVLLVQVMLVHGANIKDTDDMDRSALHYAVGWQHTNCARLLIEYGACVNAQDSNGSTSLMYAAYQSNTELSNAIMTRLLLEHGASVKYANKGGWTALHYAVMSNNNLRVVRMLLAHGADPQGCNQSGFTAVSLAQEQKRPDMAALLQRRAK